MENQVITHAEWRGHEARTERHYQRRNSSLRINNNRKRQQKWPASRLFARASTGPRNGPTPVRAVARQADQQRQRETPQTAAAKAVLLGPVPRPAAASAPANRERRALPKWRAALTPRPASCGPIECRSTESQPKDGVNAFEERSNSERSGHDPGQLPRECRCAADSHPLTSAGCQWWCCGGEWAAVTRRVPLRCGQRQSVRQDTLLPPSPSCPSPDAPNLQPTTPKSAYGHPTRWCCRCHDWHAQHIING